MNKKYELYARFESLNLISELVVFCKEVESSQLSDADKKHLVRLIEERCDQIIG